VRIRIATGDDATAIAEVLAATATEGLIATEPPVDVQARASRMRAEIEGEGLGAMWVLDDAGRVVGTAGVHETGVAGVLSLGMALLPEARGRGFGRALLETVVRYASDRGAHKVELEVWPDNAVARALYEAAGFQVEGMRRDHYRRRDGSLRSAVIMARLLPADGGGSSAAPFDVP
jgi:putative acetyltransferase